MPETRITSLANPRIKELVRMRNRRAREAAGEILIDGVREIGRAVQAGLQPPEVYFCPEYLTDSEARTLLDSFRNSATRLLETSPPVFDRIRYGDRTGGIVAVASRPMHTLAELAPQSASLIAVLEGVEKPGNLGAIVRTADGAGVDAVLVIDPIVDVYNPNAIRASIGTIFSMPIIEIDAPAALAWLISSQYSVFAATPAAKNSYAGVDFTRRSAIVLGSESRGLSRFWDRPEVCGVRIPMAGLADSLNVAATAAIVFYEAARQRTTGTI